MPAAVVDCGCGQHLPPQAGGHLPCVHMWAGTEHRHSCRKKAPHLQSPASKVWFHCDYYQTLPVLRCHSLSYLNHLPYLGLLTALISSIPRPLNIQESAGATRFPSPHTIDLTGYLHCQVSSPDLRYHHRNLQDNTHPAPLSAREPLQIDFTV